MLLSVSVCTWTGHSVAPGANPAVWRINEGKLRTENGEFIIVLDSQDRENEGDLIIAAESITDAQMAFLVRYTRLELTRARF